MFDIYALLDRCVDDMTTDELQARRELLVEEYAMTGSADAQVLSAQHRDEMEILTALNHTER